MTLRRKLVCVMLGGAAAVSLYGQAAATPAAVTLDSGSILQVCAQCSPRKLRAAVTPTDARFKVKLNPVEQPTVVETSFGNVRDASVPPLFAVEWELAKDGTPLALLVTVDGKVKRAGNYDLILNLQPASKPLLPRLKLQIVVPTGTLEAPEKLHIMRTVRIPGLWNEVNKESFALRESSQASGIDIQIEHRPSFVGQEPVTGGLEFSAKAEANCKALPAGPQGFTLPASEQWKDICYGLKDPLPLGTVTTSLRFLAPQLAQPVVTQVEIVSKLSRAWLLIAVMAGLFLGYLLKVRIAEELQRAQARVKAKETLDPIVADLGRFPDKDFQNALTDQIGRMNAALKVGKPEGIEAERVRTEQAWRDAVAGLNTRRQATQTAVDDLRRAAAASHALPAEPARRLDAIREKLKTADAALGRFDVAAAKNIAEEVRDTDLTGLRQAGLEWQSSMIRFLTGLGEAKAGLPLALLKPFADQLAKELEDLKRVKNDTPVGAGAEVTALLLNMASERRAAADLLARFAQQLRQAWSDVELALENAITGKLLPRPQAFDKLKTSFLEFAGRLEAQAADPVPAEKSLEAQLTQLQANWQDGLGSQPAAPDADVNKKIDDRDFAGAAQVLATKLGAPGRRGLLSTGPAAAFPEPAPQAPVTAEVAALPSSAARIGEPGASSALVLTPEEELRRAKKRQYLVIAPILIGYLFFSSTQSYNGLWIDVWTAFLLAVSIDFSVDAFWTRIKPKTT